MINKTKEMSDTLLVSVVLHSNSDMDIMLVGRKRPNQSVDIINVFQGEKAVDLYKLLTTVEKGE